MGLGLDLSGVTPDGNRLRPGQYACVIKNAKIEMSKANDRMLSIELHDKGGRGMVTDRFNIFHRNPKPREIALKQLKKLLQVSGYPNPDLFDEVSHLNGLSVGVNIVEGEPWTNSQGEVKRGGGELDPWNGYFQLMPGVEVLGPKSEVAEPADPRLKTSHEHTKNLYAQQTTGGSDSFDDDIPDF